MLSRNRQGQTIIFEAIKHSKSLEFVQSLFTYGLNIALRDNVGRTARTFALKQNKPTYARLIDQHVLQMVISNSAAQIEDLILRSYDHLLDITDANGRSALDIAREMGNREVASLLNMCKVTQVNMSIGEPEIYCLFWNLNTLFGLLYWVSNSINRNQEKREY